jgi:hypothetical protein
MAAHKLFPGRTVALEAMLDQLGILLQRFISLESWYGDMRDHPRSISRKPWAAISACHTMERKVLPKCSLRHTIPWPQAIAASYSAALGNTTMSENEPLPAAKPTLEELVARITDDNRHPETDWGEPVGEEVW